MITDYIPRGHKNAISRVQLAMRTGLTDRKCRRLIEEARLDGEIILCASDGKGYFIYDGPDDDIYLRTYRKQEARRYSSIGRTLRMLGKVDRDRQVKGQLSLFGE